MSMLTEYDWQPTVLSFVLAGGTEAIVCWYLFYLHGYVVKIP
jgi:hypothetical protein